MSKIKTLLLLGGTGFVGRAVAEKYLEHGWQVIILTRCNNVDEAKEKIIRHGFNSRLLEAFSKHRLIFATNIDLADEKWSQKNNWLKLFDELNVYYFQILRIINLVSESSKSADEILKSNVGVLNSIFVLVQLLKSNNKAVIFCSMGSTAERKQGRLLPPYEHAKKIVREKTIKSGLCDFHFIANYIKGEGEQKMMQVAPILWSKLRFSHKWLFGFEVSIVDVDDLAETIYHILEEIRPLMQKRTLEINITNGELLFGEMIKNLLPEDRRVIPRAIIPPLFEKYFLRFYAFVVPRINKKNQLLGRLADFAKRGSADSSKPIKKDFKTADEIKKMPLDINRCRVLEREPNLIVMEKHQPIIHVLREKDKAELIHSVQKAIIIPK